jgi:hypothetical protein
MPKWMRILFLSVLPRLFFLNRLDDKKAGRNRIDVCDGGTFMSSIDFFKRYSTRRVLVTNFITGETRVSHNKKQRRLMTKEQKEIVDMIFKMKQKLVNLNKKKRVMFFFQMGF